MMINIEYGKHDLRFCNFLFTIYMPKRPLKINHQCNQLITIDKILNIDYNSDEAIEKYKQALQVKPDFWLSCLSISYIYALKEDYATALKWTEREFEIAPSPGMKSFGLWWKCFFLFWQGRYAQSYKELQKSLNIAKSIKNEEFEAWIELLNGYVLQKMGELEQSRVRFKIWLDFIAEDDPPFRPDPISQY